MADKVVAFGRLVTSAVIVSLLLSRKTTLSWKRPPSLSPNRRHRNPRVALGNVTSLDAAPLELLPNFPEGNKTSAAQLLPESVQPNSSLVHHEDQPGVST